MMSKNYFFKEKKKLWKLSDPVQPSENNVVRNESTKPTGVFQTKEIVQKVVDSAAVLSLNETARKILKDKERDKRAAGRFLLWSDEEESPCKNDLPLRTTSNEVESDPEQSRVDINQLLSGEAIPSCPVCSKKNPFEQNDAFIPHLKKCAAKNHLSIGQLIKAIELHQKQANERTALGLPTKQEKAAVKRSGTRKAGIDTNLELAMALSASLRESEMMGRMRETEILLEAGLEKEALSQCRKLEDFGFMGPAAPTTNSSSRSVRKPTNIRNTVLFTRSKQERERILSEKIAIILLDVETLGGPVSALANHARELKSRFLKMHLDLNSTLWTKSYHLDELDGDDSYYCKNLSTFVSPCKVYAGAKLRHVSQIPQRLPSPLKSEIKDFSLSELESLYFPPEPEPAVAAKNAAPVASLFQPEFQPEMAATSTTAESSSEHRKLSQAWKSLVNESTLSDITIYARNEIAINAHKLVLHVRCPAILTEAIKECVNGKCREMIMWMNYDYETIIVFLEYLYGGDLAGVHQLSEKQRTDLKDLSLNYSVYEVKSFVDQLELGTDEPIVVESDDEEDAVEVEMTEGEKNLRSLEQELEAQKLDDSPFGSPEMFANVEDESTLDELHLSSSEEEIELPKAAEKRKSRSPPEEDRGKKFKFKDLTCSDVEIDFNTPEFSQLSIAQSPSGCSSAQPRNEETKMSPITVEDSDSTPDLIDQNNDACVVKTSPYISPVWDGFENMNYDCVDGFGYEMETNTPRLDRTKVAETSAGAKAERRSNEPFFDSFDINVSDFDRVVDKEIARTQPIPSGDDAGVQNITPLSVRKLARRSKSDNVLTPVSKSISDITPMADYSNMKTKDLKKELDRYGLKPGINRSKAKKLLRYIYDQLHPYEDDLCAGGAVSSASMASNSRSVSENGNIQEDKENDSSDEGSSQSSGVEFLGESSLEEEEDVLSQDMKGGTQTNRVNLDVGFRKLIDQDKDLHQKILLYEPVWLESLKSSLKALNVKFSANELVNYLDEKCITYRTLQTRNRRKRRKLKPGTATQVSA